MPDRARIQVKTNADPETWEDVGPAGGTLPVSMSGATETFEINAVDDYSTANVVYICMESATGTWWIQKIDDTGNFLIFTHATVENNPTKTTYALAFADRVSLTYETYAEAN